MNFLHNQAEAYEEYLAEKRGYIQAVEDYLKYCKGNMVSSLTALQNSYEIFEDVLSKDELKAIQREVYDEKSSSK